uniref:Metalloendopeptidase n=1 Tax=Globodera pallida TaxID=36090 RepID=A0A183CG09_GLOPA
MDLPQYLNNPNKTVLSRCEQLGDDCEPIRQLLRKIDKMREWCSPFSLSEPCIGRRRTPPTPDDLKPFKRPSWDKTDFPSTEIPRIDEKTDDDPLDDGDDVLVTKQQAQTEYDQFMEACAKCRNSSKMEKEKRRQKRQFLIGANKWTKENTCVRFTFDKFNEENGIEIMDNGNTNICGQSPVGQTSGWQQISLNCRDMSTASHELLHALGLHHEHQRNDGSSYIKLNPLEKENAKKTETHGFPYDFGSRMHGGPGRGAHK